MRYDSNASERLFYDFQVERIENTDGRKNKLTPLKKRDKLIKLSERQ